MTDMKKLIMELSRQKTIDPFFDNLLDDAIQYGDFPSEENLKRVNQEIIDYTSSYSSCGINTVVIGMSGGIDSALTAAIFKRAGYRVVGVTLPIMQKVEETERGVAACKALGIEHYNVDLTELYYSTVDAISNPMPYGGNENVRKGNIRARLRMVTLYDLAYGLGGMVASTDNLSELSAGFWTLHGDVGDFSPIQSLWKSWEVPYLARLNGVPENIVKAVPTDGLDISNGDEEQLGCTYLEWDLTILNIGRDVTEENDKVHNVYRAVRERMGKTRFKRNNPHNVPHPLQDRYEMITQIDNTP